METQKTIALITGANRGLGFEIARQLGNKGFIVLLGSRDQAAGDAAAEQLTRQGTTAYAVTLDITKSDSISLAVKTVETRFGRLDIGTTKNVFPDFQA